jgi:serine/threonine protein kinase
MKPSFVCCFNPVCENPIQAQIIQEKCEFCGQKSLKIGDYFATRALKTYYNETRDIRVKLFLTRKEGDSGDHYIVKLIYKSDLQKYQVINALVSNPAADFASTIKDASVLNSRLIKIKEQTPDPEHIPQVVGIYQNDFCMYVVSRYIRGKNLLQKIVDEGASTQENVLNIFESMTEALKKIHDRNFVHGDIKPENVIFSSVDNGKVFFVDPLAAKYFDNYKYIPRDKTAYISPELQKHINSVNNGDNYLEDYTISHDLYAISAIFVKILSNNINNDRDMRDDDGLWTWQSRIDGIDELNSLLNRLIAKKATDRNNTKVDAIIACIRSLQQGNGTATGGASLSSNDDFWIRFLLSLKPFEGLDKFYHNLPPESKKRRSVQGLMYLVPILFFLYLSIQLIAAFKPPIPNPSPPNPSSTSFLDNNQTLIVGYVDIFESQVQKRDYPGFKEYLETELRKQYGNNNIKVDIDSAPNTTEAKNKINEQKWDIAFTSYANISIIAEDNQYKAIARMSPQQQSSYRNVCFFVRSDSKINEIKDIRSNQAIALPSNQDLPLFRMSLYDLYGKKIKLNMVSSLAEIKKQVDSGIAVIGVSFCESYSKDVRFKELSASRRIPVGAVFLSPRIQKKSRESQDIKNIIFSAPKHIQEKANYTPHGQIPDYTQFRNIHDTSQKLFNCINWTKNPVEFYSTSGCY